MITAVVGAGGKTTLIHDLARQFRAQGKKVFVTTSTHMYIEPDTLLTDDTGILLRQLEETGYVMAGRKWGEKISPLSETVYHAVCAAADEVLVEADGSKHMPLKFPIHGEPVIWDNVEKIIVVCGLQALGKSAKEAAFRLEAVEKSLGIAGETRITPAHIQKLVQKGYVEPLKERYPEKQIEVHAVNDGTLYQRALSALLEAGMDVSLIREEWFAPKPCLFICGSGHVAQELAEIASRLDFRVKVMDDREDFANPGRFPHAEEVICDSFRNLDKYLVPDAFYAVATPGHQNDLICVQTILGTPYRYLGMIGSRTKVARAFESLAQCGVTQERLQTIHAPIGLRIGAVTPAEIAVSILAEIIQEKNIRSASSVSSELLHSQSHGMLCIIIEKKGSAPRGAGSMMLVTEDGTLDTIGGGAVELAAIEDARSNSIPAIREYQLNTADSGRLGMVCGGSNKVLFLPV